MKLEEQELDSSFLDDEAGAGFEEFGVDQQAIPLLLICQNNSADAIDAGVKPGEFYNSISKKSYGNSVNLVPTYYKIAWIEWVPNGGGFAGRYEPGSIDVEGDVYSGMTNPKNGNKVVETWLYYVLLTDHTEDGFFVFSSTPGNMKYLKAWNTQMKYLRLPSGKAAPLYSSIWNLTTSKDQNKAGQKYYSCKAEGGKPGIERVEWISKSIKTDYVDPIRKLAPQARLQLTHLEDDGRSTTDMTSANEDY